MYDHRSPHPTNLGLASAWQQGYLAGLTGVHPEKNPYTLSHGAHSTSPGRLAYHRAWQQGRLNAQEFNNHGNV